MGIFGKSAQQKRIDADALVIAELRTEVARTGVLLTKAREEADRLERQVSWWSNLAASYSEERDGYRERLLRFTAPRERGPGGRFVKPPVAAAQAVQHG